jgi:hypothetical protein
MDIKSCRVAIAATNWTPSHTCLEPCSGAQPFGLANNTVVAEDGLYPPAKLESSPTGAGIVVLAGRAIHVP